MTPIRRSFDFILALALLCAASPILLATALLLRFTIGKPLFFRQVRAGLHGKPFRIWKFRTMTDSLDARGELLPDEQRLTRFGAFLRRTSLDEFPQLLNVLRGEMSLVGPRPLLVRYVERYSPRQKIRLKTRPGLTGWAQIHGRNRLNWEDRLELDVWYVEHQSLALDMKIFALTIWQILSGKNPPEADLDEFYGEPGAPAGSPSRKPVNVDGL